MRISDWSSDVCASDLEGLVRIVVLRDRDFAVHQQVERRELFHERLGSRARFLELLAEVENALDVIARLARLGEKGLPFRMRATIGRASCRESVCQYV